MKIKKQVLDELLALAENAFPREVAGFLIGDPVSDFILAPGEFFEDSVLVYLDRMPIYASISGTFHSHPGTPRPSKQDLNFFSKLGKHHLIIGYPVSIKNCYVFNSSGKMSKLEVL
ncbi:MAG: Mov34/MPN/PAD-1 family protein [archaeon]